MIDAILKADLTAPRKQRHTIMRIYERLLDEHDAFDISYPMVRAYVAARREEIRLQAGKGVVDAFVLQTHRPGAEVEFDFGDVTVKLASEQQAIGWTATDQSSPDAAKVAEDSHDPLIHPGCEVCC